MSCGVCAHLSWLIFPDKVASTCLLTDSRTMFVPFCCRRDIFWPLAHLNPVITKNPQLAWSPTFARWIERRYVNCVLHNPWAEFGLVMCMCFCHQVLIVSPDLLGETDELLQSVRQMKSLIGRDMAVLQLVCIWHDFFYVFTTFLLIIYIYIYVIITFFSSPACSPPRRQRPLLPIPLPPPSAIPAWLHPVHVMPMKRPMVTFNYEVNLTNLRVDTQ